MVVISIVAPSSSELRTQFSHLVVTRIGRQAGYHSKGGAVNWADYRDIRLAALRARRLYPGEVGELLQRELLAYADFGHRFAKDTLIPELAAQMLEDHRVRGS
jgi:hypothetical protein